MEFILIFVAAVAVLTAVLVWSRRGQSSIGRESGDPIEKARSKAQVLPFATPRRLPGDRGLGR
jgi:hypothetical protein